MTVYQTICSHTETMMELPTNQFKLFQHLNARPVTHLKLATTLKTLAKLRSGPKKLETQLKQNSIRVVSNLQLATLNIIETSSQQTLIQK